MPADQEREYRYIDLDRIDETIAAGDCPPVNEEPGEVLYEAFLDLLQLAAAEGMREAELDGVLERIFDYRAARERRGFTVHVGSPRDETKEDCYG
ncbi:MAG: hypothetical protein JKY65_28195 [Planctomycetes bacterium]|nr:hypothetical protein [Planctomycetota bacterium]